MARPSNSSPHLGYGFPAVLAILVLSLAPLAAASAGEESPELALRYGAADSHYDRSGLGLRLGSLWSTDWGNWKATLRPELELSQFRYTGSIPGPDSMVQGGGIGLLHLHYGDSQFRPYAELGLGVSLFSRDRLGSKDFSTHFQFSEHLGLGVELAKRGFAGVQLSHYSNADIEQPNDGIDLHQIVIGMHL